MSTQPVTVGGQSGNVGSAKATGSTGNTGSANGGTSSTLTGESSGGARETVASPSAGGNTSSGTSQGGSSPSGSSREGTNSGNLTNGGSGLASAESGGADPKNTDYGGAATVTKGGTSSVTVGGRAAITRGGAAQSGAKNGGAGGSGGKTNVATTGWAHAGNINAGSTCGNGTKDGDESDVDCGGSCAPLGRCEVGQACVDAGDCTTTTCISKACAEPIVVVKNAGCAGVTGTCPTTANVLGAKLQVLNVGTDALPLKGLEIRYYYTDDLATSGSSTGASIVELDDKAPSDVTVTLVAMTTPTVTADHYVKITYATSSLVPDTNRKCDRTTPPECAEVSFRIHQANYEGLYDPSNDYSFVPSPSIGNNGLITVHQDGAVIWGTPPE
jgi:hypothetical protein